MKNDEKGFRVSKRLPAIQELIYCLEDWGFSISMKHTLFKIYELPQFHPINSLEIKGYTILLLEHEDLDDEEVGGISYCSIVDTWDKTTGTKIAFTNAIHNLSETIGRYNVKEIFCVNDTSEETDKEVWANLF